MKASRSGPGKTATGFDGRSVPHGAPSRLTEQHHSLDRQTDRQPDDGREMAGSGSEELSAASGHWTTGQCPAYSRLADVTAGHAVRRLISRAESVVKLSSCQHVLASDSGRSTLPSAAVTD